MSKSIVEKSFTYQNRKFFITSDYSESSTNDSIQLNEEIKLKGKPLKHYIESDGILNKTEPIVFACKDEKGEIEISMQYEGFPLEPLLVFLKTVNLKWKLNSNLFDIQ